MKKSNKRLSISVETVRNLDATQLISIAAGATPPTQLQNGRGFSCQGADVGCRGIQFQFPM